MMYCMFSSPPTVSRDRAMSKPNSWTELMRTLPLNSGSRSIVTDKRLTSASTRPSRSRTDTSLRMTRSMAEMSMPAMLTGEPISRDSSSVATSPMRCCTAGVLSRT